MLEKLKSLVANDLVFYSLLLVLVAVASFGLGRQSLKGVGGEVAQTGIITVDYPTLSPVVQTASVISAVGGAPEAVVPPVTVQGALVASKSGTKYHLPTCPGAKQIKPANLISFASAAEATAAGYTPAANCPGL
jgi:hypothetical protein